MIHRGDAWLGQEAGSLKQLSKGEYEEYLKNIKDERYKAESL